MKNKTNIVGLSLDEINTLFQSIGQPKYRADQLFNWIYKKKITSFDEITNFSKKLQDQCKEIASLENLKLIKTDSSKNSDTVKLLCQLNDGMLVESVYMLNGKRKTVCLSSQVGCAMNCHFCATAKMGFKLQGCGKKDQKSDVSCEEEAVS